MGFLLLSSEETPNNSKISPLPERGLGFFEDASKYTEIKGSWFLLEREKT
jgi:hypothetical protein